MLVFKTNYKLFVIVPLLSIVLCSSLPGLAQKLLRDRLQQRFIKNTQNKQNLTSTNYKQVKIAGLEVAVLGTSSSWKFFSLSYFFARFWRGKCSE